MKIFGKAFPLNIAFIFVSLFLIPCASIACSCISQGNLIERRNQSDLAFVGHAVSETIDSLRNQKSIKFAVHKIVRNGKKEEAKWILVETNLGSAACGFELDAGHRAMIFAELNTEEGREIYRTSLCSENIIEPTKSQRDSLWLHLKKSNR